MSDLLSKFITQAINLYGHKGNEICRQSILETNLNGIVEDISNKILIKSFYRDKSLDLKIDDLVVELKILRKGRNWGLEEILIELYLISQGRIKIENLKTKSLKYLALVWNEQREPKRNWEEDKEDIELLMKVTGKEVKVEKYTLQNIKEETNKIQKIANYINSSPYSYLEIDSNDNIILKLATTKE